VDHEKGKKKSQRLRGDQVQPNQRGPISIIMAVGDRPEGFAGEILSQGGSRLRGGPCLMKPSSASQNGKASIVERKGD